MQGIDDSGDRVQPSLALVAVEVVLTRYFGKRASFANTLAFGLPTYTSRNRLERSWDTISCRGDASTRWPGRKIAPLMASRSAVEHEHMGAS